VEATNKRIIKSGERYNDLFPKAVSDTVTIQKNANVYDTVAFIPKVVHQTLYQTAAIAQALKRATVRDTCKAVWQFVYEHIAYKKDAEGYEQIRSPSRAWQDRFRGVDCDCYSVFISSVLSNLGIPHSLRITKYHRDYFQHIYPIVPIDKGYITMDCVTNQFDYEVAFSEKKDYPMDLQYLNGLEGNAALYADPNEAYYLSGNNGMDELGKLIQRGFANNKKTPLQKRKPFVNRGSKAIQKATPNTTKKPKGIKRVLNKINKINPATIAIRNGILASMKLNIKNVAGRLRWSYLSPDEAAKRGIDLARFQKLIATRQRLENILYKSGGKPDNLRKAIMNGKGNKDKAVHGFEGLEGVVDSLTEYTPIETLLGVEIHYAENVEGMEGLGALGEPLTLTSIAAASGVIAGIVGMLKQVGDIFQKKTKGSEDFNETKNEQAEAQEVAPPVVAPPALPAPTEQSMPTPIYPTAVETTPVTMMPIAPSPTYANHQLPIQKPQTEVWAEEKAETKNAVTKVDNSNADTLTTATDKAAATPEEKPDGFWDKNKKWLKPAAIGVGGITLLAIGVYLVKGSGNRTAANKSPSKTLGGVPTKKPIKHYHRKKATPPRKKEAIALY
jgi:hypothetical protein